MCGFIALFSDSHSWHESVLEKGLAAMADRGPDGYDKWWSENRYVGLAHRRLSIIDLNSRSSQPMVSSNQRYVIVFNGEIYNYKELRQDLINYGVNLQTKSDTEVILELFSLFSENCLQKLRGMFAFSIWDKTNKTLFSARDPYGIKPLYFVKSEYGFLVASQVKSLLSTGIVSKEGCPNGQGGYWLLGSVPEPYTWFKDISALPAGNCMWLSKNGVRKKSWHSIANSWNGLRQFGRQRDTEAQVRKALHESIQAHLVSDVPIGIFLSGGIDSTSLLAVMRDLGVSNVIGITLKYSEFEGTKDDESNVAAYAAEQYDAQHHIRVISKSEFKKDLPSILSSMDQPSIDGINTWYASKCASEIGLKVVISGIGGDELFQGYRNFTTIPRLVVFWRIFSKIPGVELLVRFLMKKKAIKSKNLRWSLFADLAKSIPGAWFLKRSVFAPEELHELLDAKLATEFLTDFNPISMVLQMSGDLPNNSKLALSQIESTCYLRNQLLRDSDWASMSHGVELRTPLVDAWLLKSIQSHMSSFHSYTNKSLLSSAPKVPLSYLITQKNKTGFSIPVNQWLREINPGIKECGASRGWAREVADKIYQDFY